MTPTNSEQLQEQTWELLLEVMSQGERHQLNSDILTPYHTQLLALIEKQVKEELDRIYQNASYAEDRTAREVLDRIENRLATLKDTLEEKP